MRKLDVISYVLLLIGALNWGLVGLFNFNLVDWIFGPMSLVSRIIYILVGLCAVYEIFALPVIKRRWGLGRYATTSTLTTP